MTTETYNARTIKAALLAGEIDVNEAVRRLLKSWFGNQPYSARDSQEAIQMINSWAADTTTAGTTIQGADTTQGPPSVGLREEELGGLPTFLQWQRGAGVPQYGPFGAWARGQFGPAREVFLATQAASGGAVPATGQFEEEPFSQFLSNLQAKQTLAGGGAGLGLGGQLGQQAGRSFADILASLGGREATPLTAYQEQYALPETAEQFGQGGELARQAATGRMGGLAAQHLMPSVGDLYQRFLGGAQGSDVSRWLPWLKQYLGL